MNKTFFIVFGLLLVGCPSPSKPLSPLASCEILQNWQHEGQESWHKAIKNSDGTYTLCGEPFHRGAIEGECILPPIGDAVMVEGQTEDYPHHRVAELWCLDAINGSVTGRCKNGWNCKDVWDKAGSSPDCTAIPARRAGTCEAMWGVHKKRDSTDAAP